MQKMTTTKFDLLLETKGHCFLCLALIPSELPPSEQDPEEIGTYSIRSLHILTRYLEMDRTKLFPGKMPIPPHLLAKVEQSELKASLCGDCAPLNKQFSELNQQLETIKMQRTFCIKRIHQKLKNSDMTRISEQFQKSTDKLNSSVKILEKIEILEALRKDALDKCSLKANNPVVVIQKLNTTHMNKEVQNDVPEDDHQPESNSTSDLPQPSKHLRTRSSSSYETKLNFWPLHPSSSDMDIGHVKLEPTSSPPPSVDFQDYDDDVEDNLELSKDDTENPIPETDMKPEVLKKDAKATWLKRKKSSSRARTRKKPYTEGIRQPRILPYTVIMKTREYKCNLCSEIFPSYHPFYQHHRHIHRRSRFECKLCGKVFNHSGHLTRHNEASHKGIRYKCPFCGQLFSQTSNLARHQQSKNCASGMTPEELSKKQKCACCLCGMNLTSLGSLQDHLKEKHPYAGYPKKPPKSEQCVCDLCDKTFSFKSALKRHRKRFHQGTIENVSEKVKSADKRTQESEKHACDLCGKTFTKKSAMKRHRRFH